jgi:hypothetical protein
MPPERVGSFSLLFEPCAGFFVAYVTDHDMKQLPEKLAIAKINRYVYEQLSKASRLAWRDLVARLFLEAVKKRTGESAHFVEGTEYNPDVNHGRSH